MLLARFKGFLWFRSGFNTDAERPQLSEARRGSTEEVAGAVSPVPPGRVVISPEDGGSREVRAEHRPQAGDDTPSPRARLGATPPAQGRAGNVGPANPCEAENKITGASAMLAQGITECLEHFLLEANRQATINRDQFQIAQSALTSLAKKFQELDDRLVALNESTEVTDRNHHDLANRLCSVERHLETSDPDIERRIGESFKTVSEKVKTQGTIIWSLEQMVHEQAQKIDTRLATFASQVTKELENIACSLATHAELIGRLSEAQAAAEAAQKSLDQRLNQQAKAIESVQGGAEAQGEAWGQVAALTAQLAHSFTKTDQELGVPDQLQAAQRRRVSEAFSTVGEPADPGSIPDAD